MKKIKTWLLNLLIPVQKLLQQTGEQEALITHEQVELIKKIIKPGDILLSFEFGRPTSKLIKGFWDHAAIYTDQSTVMEAVGDKIKAGVNIGGVKEVDLEEWLYKKDHVAIVRPTYTDDFINRLASREAMVYKGKGYDYTFSIGSETVYCSELVYLCYRQHDKNFMAWVKSDQEILPQDYFDLTLEPARNGMIFNLIFDSRFE